MPRGRAREGPYPRSVGVLGLNASAVAVASRLLVALPAGTAVNFFGHTRANAAHLLTLGARQAVSAADLAARSELVIVLLDDVTELPKALTGPTGVQAGVHSPTVLVMGSIVPPDQLRVVARQLLASTAGLLTVVDAPLEGPRTDVELGELSIVVGASPLAYETALPVLALLGRCTRVGTVGSGQIAKSCEQVVVGATAVALAEATLIAERSGLDPTVLLAAWLNSSAASRVLELNRESLLRTDLTGGELTVRPTAQALGLAEVQSRLTGVRAAQLVDTVALFDELTEAGLAQHDLGVAREIVARRSVGVEGRELGD
ncbi:MAG TPA: NAD(P)-binding domain-containing protein [Propionibacteriaceae bacterium]